MEVSEAFRDKPSHPGKLLDRVLLRNYKMSVAELAKETGIESDVLKSIVAGDADIDTDIADSLRPVFKTAADGLLRLQNTYDFFRENGRKPSQEERETLQQRTSKLRF